MTWSRARAAHQSVAPQASGRRLRQITAVPRPSSLSVFSSSSGTALLSGIASHQVFRRSHSSRSHSAIARGCRSSSEATVSRRHQWEREAVFEAQAETTRGPCPVRISARVLLLPKRMERTSSSPSMPSPLSMTGGPSASRRRAESAYRDYAVALQRPRCCRQGQPEPPRWCNPPRRSDCMSSGATGGSSIPVDDTPSTLDETPRHHQQATPRLGMQPGDDRVNKPQRRPSTLQQTPGRIAAVREDQSRREVTITAAGHPGRIEVT